MSKIHVAAYYFPNYHRIERYEKLHGKGWTEWEVVKCARARFEGHQQPKVPLWGYEDESDPMVMSKKIDVAVKYGVDSFIFDWYYYEDGPSRQYALERGFLEAPNNDKMNFSLMWANHDAVNMHPAPHYCRKDILKSAKMSLKAFEGMMDYIINNYFKHPSYWKIDACPYFSIYELYKLVEGLGTVEATMSALQLFREKTKKAGFPDLHLNAVVWGVQILPTEKKIDNPAQLLDELGFDSVSSYAWVHHAELNDFPVSSYEEAMQKNIDFWNQAQDEYKKTYYPNITMGWDSSPRTVQSDIYENIGYPFMPVLDTTPEKFKIALQEAATFLADRPANKRMLSINAWNEWTEGSYLEPDTVHGYDYLKAIKEVLG